jgi:hypothetical protein
MADDVKAVLKPGDFVSVRGLRPRDADVIAAAALNCADGTEIYDRGPPKQRHAQKSQPIQVPMSASGRVRLALFTAKGKIRGALLEDGTILRLSLKTAEEIPERLQPGATIEVWGMGLETRHGRVIEVHQVGSRVMKLEVVIKSKKLSLGAAVLGRPGR